MAGAEILFFYNIHQVVNKSYTLVMSLPLRVDRCRAIVDNPEGPSATASYVSDVSTCTWFPTKIWDQIINGDASDCYLKQEGLSAPR